MKVRDVTQKLLDQLPYGWRFASFQLCVDDEYVVRVKVPDAGEFDLTIRRAR